MQLYHHKTDGGAEYLTDKFIECRGGHKEGIFDGAKFIVRIDGDITKDAELTVRDDLITSDLLAACKALCSANWNRLDDINDAIKAGRAAIAKAESK